MRQKKRLRAIVRAFDLILTFESEGSDTVLEAQTQELISEINAVLKKHLVGEIPQLSFDDHKGKKKMKIGVTPVYSDTEDESNS